MKIRFWLGVSAAVVTLGTGCGGSGDTVEYENAVITRNPDASLTISDGDKEARFTTFQLKEQQGSIDQPRSGMLEGAACTCTHCGCSGTTCVCTGCTGDCPKAATVAE
jgi:hypothetical protein